nr:MAG TPA: hypothetical protein [Microviridae sp.]
MNSKKQLILSQDEIFKLRSIARSFNTFNREILTSSSGEKYYSFDGVILSKSEVELLEKFEALNPLNYD